MRIKICQASHLHRFLPFLPFIGCALKTMLFFVFRCLLFSTFATLAAFCRWYERLDRSVGFAVVAASMSTSEDMVSQKEFSIQTLHMTLQVGCARTDVCAMCANDSIRQDEWMRLGWAGLGYGYPGPAKMSSRSPLASNPMTSVAVPSKWKKSNSLAYSFCAGLSRMGVVVAEASRVGVDGGVGIWSLGWTRHAGIGTEIQGERDAPWVVWSSFASSDEFAASFVSAQARPLESRWLDMLLYGDCGGIPSTSVSRLGGFALPASSSSLALSRSFLAASTGPKTFFFKLDLFFLTDVARALFAILSTSGVQGARVRRVWVVLCDGKPEAGFAKVEWKFESNMLDMMFAWTLHLACPRR